ncbi:cobalamin biosynthesis protein [Brucella thiophenivorans]|uniref:cobalamin biosynthesis protein n=1 Tax=Brucella thiophenivorans TaxID=571255 RepID=UPI000B988A66|nr:cobalamin biosynthesis protein [Brucella thiophenivorans]
MGSSSGVSFEELISLADVVLAKTNSIKPDVIATIDTKQADPVWHKLAAYYGCELQFFGAARLDQETPRIKNPSEAVFVAIGCHGVAESAALAASGPKAVLLIEKTVEGRATAALAMAHN